jgi:curli production assembly/transport component CsgG
LRFAGVILDGGIIGYDSNETTGGLGATYLGIGADTQYRQDIVTVALRAVSVQTGRVLASVTTTKTVYSVLVHGSAFQFVAVDRLLQAEAGFTKNAPTTLAVREGIQLAVYALIFEGAKDGLWTFKDPVAGAAFMRSLEEHKKAMQYTLASRPSAAPAPSPPQAASLPPPPPPSLPRKAATLPPPAPRSASLPPPPPAPHKARVSEADLKTEGIY